MGSFGIFLLLVGVASTFGMDGMMSVLHRAARQASTCTSAYSAVSGSTMCLTDSSNYITGTAGVSTADKALILQKHNAFRAGVSPNATAMPKLYWDDELASMAEKWAKQCYLGHEEHLGYTRMIPDYGMTPGQNGAFGYGDWTQAIDGWHGEVADFTYGQGPTVTGDVVGHYTQIVAETAVLIGCGYAECSSGYQHFYFCNYLRFQTSLSTPYASGSSCSGCSGTCSGQLCDCGGTFCFNFGTLDLNSCQCACQTGFTGNTCLDRVCNGKICQNGGTLDVSACTCACTASYSGDTCQTLVCNGKTCQNGGTLNTGTCTCACTGSYTGDTCQTFNCPVEDPGHCVTQWPVEFCTIYSNVPGSCPYMCGLC